MTKIRDVVIINRKATEYQGSPFLMEKVADEFRSRGIFVLFTESEVATERWLASLETIDLHRVFVAGGDGTFRTALNWVMSLPEDWRPTIVPIGGGNICYMAAHVGFRPKDSLWNARQVLGGQRKLDLIRWTPVKVEIEPKGKVIYCGTFGNGILYDFLKRMDDTGRKSALGVGSIIAESMCEAICTRGESAGVLEGTTGKIVLDAQSFIPGEQLGTLIGTVPKLSLGAKPFLGERAENQIWCLSYWGSFGQLGPIVPAMWFGRMPESAKECMTNEPRTVIMIETKNLAYMVDGCCKQVDSSAALVNSGVVTFKITAGEPVSLLGLN